MVEALADFEGSMLFVSHDRHFLSALSNRVLELTPEGVHQYGGGYTEYVERTGQEAPGLHPGGVATLSSSTANSRAVFGLLTCHPVVKGPYLAHAEDYGRIAPGTGPYGSRPADRTGPVAARDFRTVGRAAADLETP